MSISILIVDDHAVVRQGVRAFLEIQPDFEVIAETESGEEAVQLVEEHLPDVVLMDLVMESPSGQATIDGIEATRRIKHISPRTQVVVLTSYHEDENIFPALQAGASSYVLKSIKPTDLADVVRQTAQGEAILHPRVAGRVLAELRGTRDDVPNPFQELTKREMEVLQLIANGMSNAQIAEHLTLSEKTVKSHVTNILSKLYLSDRTQAAVLAWQKGIVRRTDR
jgi:NarL family two-component system response regulator LiaR